jgi:hypothetical protein
MGCLAHDDDGLRFHPTRRLTRDHVGDVVAVVAQRIEGLQRGRGLAATAEQSDAETPGLCGFPRTAVHHRRRQLMGGTLARELEPACLSGDFRSICGSCCS